VNDKTHAKTITTTTNASLLDPLAKAGRRVSVVLLKDFSAQKPLTLVSLWFALCHLPATQENTKHSFYFTSWNFTLEKVPKEMFSF